MPNLRLLPPPSPAFGQNPIKVTADRVYTCAVGSYLDVPDFDAVTLLANGWTHTADVGMGAAITANRPTTGLKRGSRFHDTTLGYDIVWDGLTWRNPTSGASV